MKNSKKIVQASILSLAVMVTIASTSEARVKGPRLNGHAYACGNIQDKLDKNLKALKAAKTRAEADALKAKGHSLVLDWRSAGCQTMFGNWWQLASQRSFMRWHYIDRGTVMAPKPNKSLRRPGLKLHKISPTNWTLSK